ncbi:MAG: hypothetical protein ACREIQ_10460 [Nitrospiria bacterium]
MAIGSDMKISESLITRLTGLGTSESRGLVEQFKNGQITEQQFIANAGRFLQLTRTDPAAAFNRAASLHAPKGFSLPENVYDKIFGKSDRGQRVTAVEKLILDGAIIPMEVYNA